MSEDSILGASSQALTDVGRSCQELSWRLGGLARRVGADRGIISCKGSMLSSMLRETEVGRGVRKVAKMAWACWLFKFVRRRQQELYQRRNILSIQGGP